MPRVKLGQAPRDRLKELVLGRQHSAEISNTELAAKMHMSRKQLYTWMKKPSGEWRVRDIERMCLALNIPKEEWRGAI